MPNFSLFHSTLIFFLASVRSTVVYSSTVSPMGQTNTGTLRERQGNDEASKNPRDTERPSGNTTRTSQAPQRVPTGNCLDSN